MHCEKYPIKGVEILMQMGQEGIRGQESKHVDVCIVGEKACEVGRWGWEDENYEFCLGINI